jgi:hypothetical protein
VGLHLFSSLLLSEGSPKGAAGPGIEPGGGGGGDGLKPVLRRNPFFSSIYSRLPLGLFHELYSRLLCRYSVDAGIEPLTFYVRLGRAANHYTVIRFL